MRRAGRLGLLLGCWLLPGACASHADPPIAADPPIELAAGGRPGFAIGTHVCALRGGGVQCWGSNSVGQLGDDWSAPRRPLPVRTVGLPGPVSKLDAGGGHTCAVALEALWCWGENAHQQLGGQRQSVRIRPERVPDLPSPVVEVAAGDQHTCARSGEQVWCWGANRRGEIGRAPRPACRQPSLRHCASPPGRVPGVPPDVGPLAAGNAFTCAIAADAVWCWGAGERGQLGDGASRSSARPSRVSGVDAPTALALGRQHACAISRGAVYCWGAGTRGQLGGAAGKDRSGPVRVSELPAGMAHLSAAGDRTCAAGDEAVWCWGDGASAPAPVPGIEGAVRSLAMGPDVVCAALADDAVRCHGDNDFGQLGSADAPADHETAALVAPWDEGLLRDRNGDGRLRVVCVGDSNTESRGGQRTWCDQLAALLPSQRWEIRNRGLGGGSAVGGRSLVSPSRHIDYPLENDAPDVVILAFGTNDVQMGAELDEIQRAYQQLVSRVREVGASAFVALAPPTHPASDEANPRVRALNDVLRESFSRERIIDFHTGFAEDDFEDRLHMSAEGHAKRAAVAARVLRRAAGADD